MNTLFLYFQYPFVRYALITGILISLCASLLGVVLVLKRYSFIGDGLSHVAFGALAIASFLGLAKQKMLVILPITVIAAVLLLRKQKKDGISADAKISMLSVGALAFGYLLMNRNTSVNNFYGDVCTSLFGSTSILTLSKTDVWLCVILSIAVIVFYILFYERIFALTFDEDFARSADPNVETYNLLIALIMAVIIVLAMNLVGSLLISALVVFPSLSAMQVCKSFKGVSILAACLSVFCALSGILISILAGTPVGSTIVAANVIIFLLLYVYKRLRP